MILDMITIVCIWMGCLFNVFPIFLKDTPLDFLPFNWLGVIFFIAPLIIIRWRGASTTWWLLIDFPSPNEKKGIMTEGSLIKCIRLFPSIENFLKTKQDRYFKDTKVSYFSGGHDTRLVDSNVAITADPKRAIFINKMKADGFNNYKEVETEVIKQMMFLKDENNNYLLSNMLIPVDPSKIDIKNNPSHKALFEALADKYYMLYGGSTYSLKDYKLFWETTGSPEEIGSIVHYIKSSASLKAAKLRKGTSGGTWKILLLIGIIAIVCIVIFFLAGGPDMLSGLGK